MFPGTLHRDFQWEAEYATPHFGCHVEKKFLTL